MHIKKKANRDGKRGIKSKRITKTMAQSVKIRNRTILGVHSHLVKSVSSRLKERERYKIKNNSQKWLRRTTDVNHFLYIITNIHTHSPECTNVYTKACTCAWMHMCLWVFFFFKEFNKVVPQFLWKEQNQHDLEKEQSWRGHTSWFQKSFSKPQ